MAGETDASVFLRLVEYAAAHAVLSRSDVELLADAPDALNPMSLATASTPQVHFALSKAFDSLLQPGRAPDWDRMRIGAAQIAEDLARREMDRHAASLATRWLPLAAGNRFFDFSRWGACWSRRDLEGVLGFFEDDAFYVDTVRNHQAQGNRELRSLFARLFHASDALMHIELARFVPGGAECELDWVQTSARTPVPDIAPNPGGGTLRGKSSLWVEAGKVLACVDVPNPADPGQMALAPLNCRQNVRAGTITQTDTAVTVGKIVLLKRLVVNKPVTRGEGDGE
jgi:hypothetical protein